MTKLINDPTYITFKNAVQNGVFYVGEISITSICQIFKVSPAIAAAWLQRYKRDLEKEGL